jgi:hypothetical protein
MCDTGYIIKNHLQAILQVLAVELGDISVPLQTTRCYYTAMLMVYLLIGNTNSVGQCQKQKSKSSPDIPLNVANAMRTKLLRESQSNHTIFYILISHYETEKDSKDPYYYFPGHVFIIEKVPKSTRFNMYQSYIQEYDMSQYIDNAKSQSVGRTKLTTWLDGIVDMFTHPWNERTSAFWSDMTHTNAQELSNSLNGFDINRHVKVCCHRSVVKSCDASLKKLVLKHIKLIQGIDTDQLHTTYGHHPSELNEYTPMSAASILEELKVIKSKLL